VLAIGQKDLAHARQLAERLDVAVPMAEYAADNLAAALGLSAAPAREGDTA
jgi:hypothetical protein